MTTYYQYQLANGNWIDQTKEEYDHIVKRGGATVRAVYLSAPSTSADSQDAARYRWWLSVMMMPEPMDLMERTFAHLDQDTIPTKAQFDNAVDAALKGGA